MLNVTAVISARILARVNAGVSIETAVNAVLGEGVFEALASAIYDELNERTEILESRVTLKVYGWTGTRYEAGAIAREIGKGYGRSQTREIVAATSKAAAARAAGVARAGQLWNLSETANDECIEIAMREPGRIFWKPTDDIDGEHWHVVTENGTSLPIGLVSCKALLIDIAQLAARLDRQTIAMLTDKKLKVELRAVLKGLRHAEARARELGALR